MTAPAPAPWAGHAQWCELHDSLDDGATFLQLWRAWRDDPQRPGLLHVVALAPFPPPADAVRTRAPEGCAALAEQLAQQWWGLLPGAHRLAFESGRVLLTLHVGLPLDSLRECSFTADALRLSAPGPATPRGPGELKALARLCRRGTLLRAAHCDATFLRDAASAGFMASASRGAVHAHESFEGVYDPAWSPKGLRSASRRAADHCIVVGAGLAGAAVAQALARRGWEVSVIDQASTPASGASGLPAGLMAPHLSPDDGLLSRLSRSGVRLTLQHAQSLLQAGRDWGAEGALEHRRRSPTRPIAASGAAAADWSRAAEPDEKQQALLPPDAPAAWHPRAAWVRPGALVQAWLAQPGITWRGGVQAARVCRVGGEWRLEDAEGASLGAAPLVVLAAALGSGPLSGHRLTLQPVRGQVSWGLREPGLALPPFPVNGNGHFLPAVPTEEGSAWMCGSSYVRGDTALEPRASEHQANFERLSTLLPTVAAQLAPAFVAGRVRAWTGVRCASGDRRPLVGELEPGLWASTAMGSRGLTFAALCAEVLAARLHDEPLALPLSLAMALDLRRQLPASA
ncbi:FAD-dependent 5-carboxymethylaminomethyl-2-thiouridine(34) oxidoreductase MnmC [Ramlibacter sp. AN1015]|uniref:FAD-dependent 5-carboxymethylaminomethyl-2-thiouridine(34) oxidoreductase MnmC n=1 Tax=Ramlibacter sp. AN1015 TaxID=3133428 RepID=UPI0030BBF9C4